MSTDPAAVEALYGQLRAELADYTHSGQWAAFLDGARRFHRYSPGNQLLLMLQGAHGHVASYRTWHRIPAVDGGQCQVARGETGLTIIAPMRVTARDVDEATGEEVVVAGAARGFKAIKVFHQGQLVAPPAIPAQPLPRLLTGPDRWQHVWAAVVSQLGDEGYPVRLHTRRPAEDWNGRTHFDVGYVEVMDHLEPPQRLKTLLHEWAHVALRHGDTDPPIERHQRELEAESVAYLLGHTIGLDSTDYTIPYLASWSPDGDLATSTAQRVLTAVGELTAHLEIHLGVELRPDLYRTAKAGIDRPGPDVDHDRAQPVPVPTPLRPSVAGHNGEERAARRSHPSFAAPHDEALQAAPVWLRPLAFRLDPVDRRDLLDVAGRLDDSVALRRAVELIANAADTPTAAAALLLGGVERTRLRRCMKQPVDGPGGRRFLYDDVDRAFRVGAAPACLAPEHTEDLDSVDIDDPGQVADAARLMQASGQYRPSEITAILTHLGVDHDTTRHAIEQTGITPSPPTSRPADPELSGAIDNHDTLLRTVIDDGADPARIAALGVGLGLSPVDAIAGCARIGLDHTTTARIALARRSGCAGPAAGDLAAGWSAPPPEQGWAPLLGATTIHDISPTPSTSGPPQRTVPTAHGILEQWRQTSTSTPTPAMP